MPHRHHFRHPVNIQHHTDASTGERLADQIASGIGSWRFLIVQTIAVLAWLTLNLVGLARHWDPFPFILLNLLFSVQAAYTGPVLLLAGNRQAQKDRLTLEHTAQEADTNDRRTLVLMEAMVLLLQAARGDTRRIEAELEALRRETAG